MKIHLEVKIDSTTWETSCKHGRCKKWDEGLLKKEEVFECVGLKATPRVDALSKLTMPLSGVCKVFQLIQE